MNSLIIALAGVLLWGIFVYTFIWPELQMLSNILEVSQ